MRINRDNYESFLVDYSEGILPTKLRQEVERFLLLNPDIKDEFEMFSTDIGDLKPDVFLDKENLKNIPFQETTASSDYFQQLCVAYIDGLLPEYERNFLEELIKKDDEKKKEFTAFKKTKLVVENEIFNEKILLKQGAFVHNINDANFEEYCIACMEGWLDHKGLLELNNYIKQHPSKKRVLDIYFKTLLTPDLSIVYPDKRKIKRFSVLSPSFKKVISVASSIAAIVVLGLMIFYTTTIDDKTELLGNVAVNQIKKEQKTIEPIALKVDAQLPTVEQPKESLLHDPVVPEKTSVLPAQERINDSTRYGMAVQHMEPIQVTKIECQPCKLQLDNKFLSAYGVDVQPSRNDELKVNNQENNKDESSAWMLAQAGIAGINRITNTEIKVEKSKEGNKTIIAFNSKYFAFSTQMNNN